MRQVDVCERGMLWIPTGVTTTDDCSLCREQGHMIKAYLVLDEKLNALNGRSSCFGNGSRDTTHWRGFISYAHGFRKYPALAGRSDKKPEGQQHVLKKSTTNPGIPMNDYSSVSIIVLGEMEVIRMGERDRSGGSEWGKSAPSSPGQRLPRPSWRYCN